MTMWTCKKCGYEMVDDSQSNTVLNNEKWLHFFDDHKDDISATNVFSRYLERND